MDILHPMLGMIALSGLVIVVLISSRLSRGIKNWGNPHHAEHYFPSLSMPMSVNLILCSAS